MSKGRQTYRVKGACPIHGEDVEQTLENATFTEARQYVWDCPNCWEENNQSVQVVEIIDSNTGEVAWKRRSKLCKEGGIEHYDYEFD